MFTTGFTMNPKAVAEPMDGPTLAWLRQQAEGCQYITSVCTGSLILGAAGLDDLGLATDGRFFTVQTRFAYLF